MKWDERKVDEAVLAVLYLTLHEEVRAWKTLDWETMDRLHSQGLISDPAGRSKSISFSEEGLRRAQEAGRRLFS